VSLGLTGQRWLLTFRCPILLENVATFRCHDVHEVSIGRSHGTSSPGARCVAENVWFRRCVDRRREEPAARRRAIDGPLLHQFGPVKVRDVQKVHEAFSLHFILSRVSSDRTWVAACGG
jgi:hypothetical protein